MQPRGRVQYITVLNELSGALEIVPLIGDPGGGGGGGNARVVLYTPDDVAVGENAPEDGYTAVDVPALSVQGLLYAPSTTNDIATIQGPVTLTNSPDISTVTEFRDNKISLSVSGPTYAIARNTNSGDDELTIANAFWFGDTSAFVGGSIDGFTNAVGQNVVSMLVGYNVVDGVLNQLLAGAPLSEIDQTVELSGWQRIASKLYANSGDDDTTSLRELTVASAANVAGQSSAKALLTTRAGDWSISHTPGENVQATVTRAAGGPGVRHVCTSITGSVIPLSGVTEAVVQLQLRDGDTGVGTILWSQSVYVTIFGVQTGFALSGLNIVGDDDTAMTLEFSAAGGLLTVESVALTGFDAS